MDPGRIAGMTVEWIRGQLLIASILAFLSFSTDGLLLSLSTPHIADLQRCETPRQILRQLGRKLTPRLDPDGNLAGLILVRLSRQLISIDNTHDMRDAQQLLWDSLGGRTEADQILNHVVACLCEADCSNPDALIEGTKAVSVLSRLLKDPSVNQTIRILDNFWRDRQGSVLLEPHHLAGLQWAYDGLRYISGNDSLTLPQFIQVQYSSLSIPFRIIPGLLSDLTELTVDALESEVRFAVDDIRTTSNHIVSERRKTAWQGEEHVGPFVYSGKAMIRDDWSEVVTTVRNVLAHRLGSYYDCCLLNLYPDGCSGMRYHIDPDQGILWDFDSAVASVGATRRFAFRDVTTTTHSQPYSFVVMHGDVVHMFADCQNRFQHTVKKADNRNEKAARISLVFKQSWSLQH